MGESPAVRKNESESANSATACGKSGASLSKNPPRIHLTLSIPPFEWTSTSLVLTPTLGVYGEALRQIIIPDSPEVKNILCVGGVPAAGSLSSATPSRYFRLVGV